MPAGATATFSPATVTPGSSAVTSTLTVQTLTSFAGLRDFGGSSTRPLLALAGLFFLITRKRRQLRLLALVLLVSLAGLASLTGCGTSSKTATYAINITGTAGTQAQTATVTLTLHD